MKQGHLGGSGSGAGSRVLYAACAFLLATSAAAQITVDKEGNIKGSGISAPVDRRYAQIEPTHVNLTRSVLDAKTRLELERLLQSEQGFAMRPFPKGHKGLTLEANGKLEPAGEPYLNMVTSQGMSAKPGDRVVLTDIKFDKNKIIFMLNGGPDAKHRFLRHIQLGTGAQMNPVVQDDGQEPQGARLILAFKDQIPQLTASDVKALLAPLISFDVKTPIQAFTDTLPPKLKDAILNHQVMVGMSTEMVLFALGPPQSKQREMEGQMPFEEWIYGAPPKPVQFVRINGNRVIRLEIAKVGVAPEIFTKDEVEGLMRTDGSPLAPPPERTRTVALGDKAPYNPDTQAAPAPPSLRKNGETLPQDDPTNRQAPGAMKPVQFPTQKPDDHPDASKLPRTPAPADTQAPEPDDDADSGKPAANAPSAKPN
ncbi:hypothetical protein DYQ86_10670 [Acidobacteria bacterium AB60]|nr:hypothetical protein DYQ86_10670 [Acidobacteria bacterium AB60]